MADDEQAERLRKEEEAAAYAASQLKLKKAEEERKRKMDEEKAKEEAEARDEARRKREDEIKRRKQEEELKKLGTDKIQPLPPIPPSHTDDNAPDAMCAWFLDDEVSKPTYRSASLKPGVRQGVPPVTLAQLKELGIVYFRINLNDFSIINQIVKHRLYKHTDEMRLSQTCKDETFLEKWFVEHFNEDEQLRLVTDGSMFMDVRSKQDSWIRLHMHPGDVICLPPGMFHRGTLDEDDYCALMRVFREQQRWAPVYRTEKRADTHPARLQYLRWLKKGNVGVEMDFK
jgi:1,2-dihydroxy-3-keto-5-methylthiopentene dioxygenase